jgi:chemotaxis methyl-accepting protein methylase
VETSFADLAHRSDNTTPAFDFIIVHGVLNYVSPENRRHIFEIIERRLRPGGLAYLGYNGLAGWSAMVPSTR